MDKQRTHYEVLGIPADATAEQVAAGYRALLAKAKAQIRSAPVDPDWLDRAREAHAVLRDPQKRAAYDRILAEEKGIAAPPRRRNFFARAWRGEVRAWKPFWLMLVPSWLIIQSVTTVVGALLAALLALIIPAAAAAAIVVLLLATFMAAAVLHWRSAFNTDWRILGYAGRLCALAMLATTGFGLYGHLSGKSHLGEMAAIAERNSATSEKGVKQNELLAAAEKGDLAQVNKLLDRGESVQVRETREHNRGRSPLHYAAGGKTYHPAGQHIEVAKLLLERGADVNAKADTGYTPLHVAAGLGHADMVELLLQNGADVHAKDTRGTPIQAAVLRGNERVVALLLEKKANPQEGLEHLRMVARYEDAHTAILKRLVAAGADPNARFGEGGTAFDALVHRSEEAAYFLVQQGVDLGPTERNPTPRAFRLAEHGHVKALQLALDKGFDPAARGTEGQTLMHVARAPAVVDLLLARGLRIDQLDGKRNQPLHAAVKQGNHAMAAYLLGKGAPVDAANEEGVTPLMLARSKEKPSIVDLLLEKGANLHARDRKGLATLDHAAAMGNEGLVRYLLEKGAVATARDANGYTALHRATRKEVAEVLIGAGASPTLAAADGQTPLHLAARQDGQVIELLLSKGADVNAADKAGRTPLHLAAVNHYHAKKLLDAGAKPEAVDKEGKTTLHYAAPYDAETAKLLVGMGLSPNAKDKFGNTPLHEAAKQNRGYLVKNLIDLGADPEIRNNEGKTAMQLAEDAARALAQKSFTGTAQSGSDGLRSRSR